MENMGDITGSINNVLNSLDIAGLDMIGTLGGFEGLGFKLLGILFVIMFAYNVFLFMLDGNSKIMVDLTKLTLTWVFLASMLAAWTSPAPTGVMKDVSVAGFFLESIPEIANKFTKGENPTGQIVDMHVSAMQSVFKVLLKEQYYDPAKHEGQAPPGLGAKILAAGEVAMDAVLTPFMLLHDGFNLIISSLLLILAFFFILWSLLTFIFILNAGQVMMYVGLGLGPILIPFLLVDKLSFLFDGWLKFMISAALYKVVAVLVALLSLGTIEYIASYSSAMATKDESMIFLSFMVLFFAILGKQLMGLADNMASSLATGGSSSGSGDSSNFLMSVRGRGIGGKKSRGKSGGEEKKDAPKTDKPQAPKK